MIDLRVPGYWYLATPYTRYPHGHDAAALEASRIAGELLLRGVNTYSPIAHSHALCAAVPGLDPLDGAWWARVNLPAMEAAHGLLVARMDGWSESEGVDEEIKWFKPRGRPILMLDPETLAPLPLATLHQPDLPQPSAWRSPREAGPLECGSLLSRSVPGDW